MGNKERIVYMDLLRIAAAGGVIMLHTAASRWYAAPVRSFHWQVMNIYDSLVRWAAPVFVMVSGAVQLSPRQISRVQSLSCKEAWRVIFKRSIFPLICALLFWGMVYQAYRYGIRYFVRREPVFLREILAIPLGVIFGPPWYHLWFIYLIIGLYLISPFVRIFIAHAPRSYLKGALILFAVIGAGVPFINFAITKIPGIPNYQLYLPLAEVSGYLGYYMGGAYLAQYRLKKQTRLVFYILGMISILLTILGTSFFSITGERREEFLYEYILPTTMASAWGIFIFFKEAFGSRRFSPPQLRIIASISGATLGIYLFHDLVLQIFLLLGISSLSFNPLFSIPLISLSVFAISLLLVRLIRNLPILGKYVV